MRALPLAAFSLLLLPSTGCINLDLANGEANVFEVEVDANGAGFGKKNIKFKQIITLDPAVDEQLGGAFAVDQLNFEPIKIEFAYLLEEMNRLEDAVSLFVDGDGNVITDPRGRDANFNVFEVADLRDKPFVVEMFVTYTRKETILEERLLFDGKFKKNRIRTIETKPAHCNFLDAKLEADCFAFDASDLGVNIGRVAGVGKDLNEDGVLLNVDNNFDGFANAADGDDVEIETTSSATFNDLIVVDNVIYLTLLEEFLEVNAGGPLNADQIAEIADQAVMVRLARDKVGTLSIFNNNLGRDYR